MASRSCTCDNFKTELTMLSSSCLCVLLTLCLPACLTVSLSAPSVPQPSQKLDVDPGNGKQSSSVEYSCGNSPLPCCQRNSLNNFRSVCACSTAPQKKEADLVCQPRTSEVIPPPLHSAGRQAGRQGSRKEGRRAGIVALGTPKTATRQ